MIYFIVYAILFAFAYYNVYSDNRKNIDNLFIAGIIIVVLLIGLRWEIGTDWRNYYAYFVNCKDIYETSFELGYVAINKIIRTLTDQYTIFLLLHSIFVFGLIGYFMSRYSQFPILSFALMFALMFGYIGMNRQYISIAFSLFSLQYVIQRRPVPFLVCTLLATLFHLTGLIFAITYFLNRPFSRRLYLIVLGFGLLIMASGIVKLVPAELFYGLGANMEDKADAYIMKDTTDLSTATILVGIVKRSVWIVFALIYYDSFKKERDFPLFFNIYVISMFFFLALANTPLQVIISRGLLSFNIMEVFIIPYIVLVFKDNSTRKIFLLLLFIYGIFLIDKSINNYAETLNQDIFNPYRCVLFTTK